MKRLFLSAAVKKMFVRFVSTLITSSESCGTSSRRGVGDGDANAAAFCAVVSFLAGSLADWVWLAIPPHTSRETKTSNTNGRLITRYCIFTSELLTAQRCQR